MRCLAENCFGHVRPVFEFGRACKAIWMGKYNAADERGLLDNPYQAGGRHAANV